MLTLDQEYSKIDDLAFISALCLSAQISINGVRV